MNIENQINLPDKEKEDQEIREEVETVTPDTENAEPEPDKSDEQ